MQGSAGADAWPTDNDGHLLLYTILQRPAGFARSFHRDRGTCAQGTSYAGDICHGQLSLMPKVSTRSHAKMNPQDAGTPSKLWLPGRLSSVFVRGGA
ncbi:hypothetical protein VFPFJ_05443 [Purpureocillium lilacinum]|uniref:Uncharacterized protein n=1 Tax=Purpureocillium lilacinum TaxID=33203 RepID=A0A179HMQ3_PURLI|nr:hypothetical protein VFPFJ_05443 [Purpureocillium lilacinum]OAQ91284.1 hypothetical protein VFPFJ_05443 [Purpureocillium lilacinum]